MKTVLTIAVLVCCFLAPACAADVTAPPRVAETFPGNGAQNVDPTIGEIWVKFDHKMTDRSWSWCYEDRSKFPQVGTPHYTEGMTTCVLPVKLEPGKEYVIWINTQNAKGFRDQAGRPAVPYRFTFRTR